MILNLAYKIYFALPNFKRYGFVGKVVNKLIEMALKRFFDLTVPKYLKRTQKNYGFGLNREKRELDYIVSLTSFPGRINDIWVTVETLLRQSFKPDRIILWLSEKQFPDREVPSSLRELEDRGLEIRFVPDDKRSHKKYFYAFMEFPDSAVITVDDDVYYPADTLKYLVEAYAENRECIIANRAHEITFKQSQLLPYRQWKHNIKSNKSSLLYVPTGVGGVLYPPGSYHEDIFDEDVFKDMCFMADDLWLKVATLRNSKNVVVTPYFTQDLLTVKQSQIVKLVAANSMGGGNDTQFKAVLKHFDLDMAAHKKSYK